MTNRNDLRPEIAAILEYIDGELQAREMMYFTESAGDDPDVWVVGARDDAGYVNQGLIGWSPKEEKVYFFCHEPARAKRDEMEGIPDDDSRCWWDAQRIDIFLLFLKGEVRDIIRRHERTIQHQLDEDSRRDRNEGKGDEPQS